MCQRRQSDEKYRRHSRPARICCRRARGVDLSPRGCGDILLGERLAAWALRFNPTAPFGVPAVLSAAFFGGLWGILILRLLTDRFTGRWAGLLAGAVFGAILPSAVALLIVLPLKGQQLGGGWQMKFIGFALLVNGARGLGTVLIARGLKRVVASP
jgi:hypothetical protein